MIVLIALFIESLTSLIIGFCKYDAVFHWVYVTGTTNLGSVFLSIDLWIVYIGGLYLFFRIIDDW